MKLLASLPEVVSRAAVSLNPDDQDYESMMRLPGSGESLSAWWASGISCVLIINLLGTPALAEEMPGRLPMPQHPRLQRICQALIEAPANSDSLDHWADRFGASSRTLARHFQREAGMPFAKWREQMRVSEAMCLLSTNTPIDEVAAFLGYADTNSFDVMFKRVLHMTRLKYQSMMRAATVVA